MGGNVFYILLTAVSLSYITVIYFTIVGMIKNCRYFKKMLQHYCLSTILSTMNYQIQI